MQLEAMLSIDLFFSCTAQFIKHNYNISSHMSINVCNNFFGNIMENKIEWVYGTSSKMQVWDEVKSNGICFEWNEIYTKECNILYYIFWGT